MRIKEVINIDLGYTISLLQYHHTHGRGNYFWVEFIKRSTGELRKMLCRFGVTFDLKGGTAKYDPAAKGLLWVYDVQKRGHRSINLNAITRLRINGKDYKVKQEQLV